MWRGLTYICLLSWCFMQHSPSPGSKLALQID